MKKENETKYRLKDVMWAYSRDGAVVIPYIWNRDMTKIKLLSNGQIIDIETKDYPIMAVKEALSHDMGYECNDIGVKYPRVVIEACHANKVKKSKIMRKFELQKNLALMFLDAIAAASVEEVFVDEEKFCAHDICALGEDFSVLLKKEYQSKLADKEESEPSYMDF